MKYIQIIIIFSLFNIVSAYDKINETEASLKALNMIEGKIIEKEYNSKKDTYEIQILDVNGIEWCIDINAKDGLIKELKKH